MESLLVKSDEMRKEVNALRYKLDDINIDPVSINE